MGEVDWIVPNEIRYIPIFPHAVRCSPGRPLTRCKWSRYESSQRIRKCPHCGKVAHNSTTCPNPHCNTTHVNRLDVWNWMKLYLHVGMMALYNFKLYYHYCFIIACELQSCSNNITAKFSHRQINWLHSDGSTVDLKRMFLFLTCMWLFFTCHNAGVKHFAVISSLTFHCHLQTLAMLKFRNKIFHHIPKIKLSVLTQNSYHSW